MDTTARQILAPTGRLRVGLYSGSPTSMIGDAGSAEARGVAHDLGRELARSLDVPFEPVVFASNAQLQEAARQSRIDVVLTNATPARRQYLDFTATVLEIEQGYLVAAGSTIVQAADIDQAGVRVGVSQGSTSQTVLSRELAHAAVVPMATVDAAVEALSRGALHAFATNKAILFEMGDKLPGSLVLEGRWGMEHFAFGIPKGRAEAMPFLERFAAEARRGGEVDRAVARADLRGALRAAPG